MEYIDTLNKLKLELIFEKKELEKQKTENKRLLILLLSDPARSNERIDLRKENNLIEERLEEIERDFRLINLNIGKR